MEQVKTTKKGRIAKMDGNKFTNPSTPEKIPRTEHPSPFSLWLSYPSKILKGGTFGHNNQSVQEYFKKKNANIVSYYRISILHGNHGFNSRGHMANQAAAQTVTTNYNSVITQHAATN